MSHDATVAAWAHIRSHSDFDALGVLVLLALADRHNALTGKLNPSIGRIAADCHCSPASVKRALHKLESLGLIKRGSGGGAASSTYRLFIPSPVPTEPGSDRTRFTQHREGVHTEPQTRKEPGMNQDDLSLRKLWTTLLLPIAPIAPVADGRPSTTRPTRLPDAAVAQSTLPRASAAAPSSART